MWWDDRIKKYGCLFPLNFILLNGGHISTKIYALKHLIYHVIVGEKNISIAWTRLLIRINRRQIQ